MTMSKLVSLNGGRAFDAPSSPTEWDDFFEQCKQRPGTCPLLKHRGMNHEVTEYQVPLDMVRRILGWSQSRVTDCHANHITELAKQIRLDPHGLRTGVCVLPNSEGEGYLDLCWGNNRLRAVQQNNDNNFAIPGLDDGHIWVTRYDYKISELAKWQALENNIHPVSQSATPEDNVDSLKEMIEAGLLDDSDKFVDCDDAEKRKRLKKIIKEVMPSSDASKLIKDFKKKNKSSFKLESYDPNDMKKRFKGIVNTWSEPYDLTGLKNNGNHVIEKRSGKRIKLLFSHAGSAHPGGSLLQTAVQSKIVEKDHDEVWLVSAHNHVAEKDLARIRAEREAIVVKWNEELKPISIPIDRMIVLPQVIKTEMHNLTVVDKRFS
jgi:hypothetical protein